jgi:hypothetical protein
MRIQLPNSSFYPEIDFASKCVEVKGSRQSTFSITELLYPLSNPDSRGVRSRTGRSRFYVSAELGHIALNLDGRSGALVKGEEYT